jgi:predicted phage terminase large subunit-like protein
MTIALVTRSRKEKLELLELQDEKARRNLLAFVKVTKPDYRVGWFNRILARELDRFLDDVVNERSPRLIIEAPPRHGKSEMASRRFPAYALGRYPDLPIIATSYASDLASAMNRDVQRIIESEEYRRLFPSTRLWGSNIRTVADGSYLRNSDIFEIVDHRGIYKSAGVGAGVTGRGGRILLVDDPIKDAAEAHSATVRAGIEDWFTSTLYTRCEPGGGMLIIMTRWHEDDLVGRRIENMRKGGEPWKVLRFPAIAEEDEFDEDGTLLRHIGEALHSARYSREALDRIKIGTGDTTDPGVGSRVWASLYQQRPAAAEGNIFKRENWRFWRPLRPLGELTRSEQKSYFHELGIINVVQAWDIALGGKETNDFTACTTLGITRNRYYVLDVWKKQCQFPEAKRQVQLLFDKWSPSRVCVEGGGSAGGKAIIQEMKNNTRLPLKETITTTDKVLRADLLSPTHEAGLCYLPEGESWVADFVDSCSSFPSAPHDDDVDSWMMSMEHAMSGSAKTLNITPELLARLG